MTKWSPTITALCYLNVNSIAFLERALNKLSKNGDVERSVSSPVTMYKILNIGLITSATKHEEGTLSC